MEQARDTVSLSLQSVHIPVLHNVLFGISQCLIPLLNIEGPGGEVLWPDCGPSQPISQDEPQDKVTKLLL